MSITTKQEFLRRQADMIDLCAGTSVDPDTCIRVVGQTAIEPITAYSSGVVYEAAVIILEGKPCFIGDRIWCIPLGTMVVVTDAAPGIIYFIRDDGSFVNSNANIERFLWREPAPEPFVDPYAALKADQISGKRIAWQNSSGEWIIQIAKVSDKSFSDYTVDRWKSVEPDVINVGQINTDYGLVDVQVTKLGLDGTILAEVV